MELLEQTLRESLRKAIKSILTEYEIRPGFKWLFEETEYYKTPESSNIKKVGYDYDQNDLYIVFKDGSEYMYPDISERLLNNLLKADSKGHYFWRYIRNKKVYTKIK